MNDQFPRDADDVPTDAELHDLEMLALLETARAQLAFVRQQRDDAKRQFDALADEVGEWQTMARRVKESSTDMERLMAASILVRSLLSPPKAACSTCEGAGRVSVDPFGVDPFGDDTSCPDCRGGE